MISKYYSGLIFQLFIIWTIGYIFKINFITKYLNLYYSTILISVGFILFSIYVICIKKEEFDVNFLLIFSILTHFLPLYITYKYSSKKYVKETFIITIILYGMIMLYINKNPINVYLHDKHPLTYNEFIDKCENKNTMFSCFILNTLGKNNST